MFAAAEPGADAAGLAFDALTAAQAEGIEVLLVDTAGRLHNKAALMEELRKVIRVLKRSTRRRRIRCCWCWTRPPARTPCSR